VENQTIHTLKDSSHILVLPADKSNGSTVGNRPLLFRKIQPTEQLLRIQHTLVSSRCYVHRMLPNRGDNVVQGCLSYVGSQTHRMKDSALGVLLALLRLELVDWGNS